MTYFLRNDPHFISLIDGKIAVILKGGYKPNDRCRMGKGEFAFTPEGRIYPCERLVGPGTGRDHCMGHIDEGPEVEALSCLKAPGEDLNAECIDCGLRDYCMNWCGCSNYFATGYYNRVNAFTCASEKATIETAFDVIQRLHGHFGPAFLNHFVGQPISNVACQEIRKEIV
jgi:uncharacterized protein